MPQITHQSRMATSKVRWGCGKGFTTWQRLESKLQSLQGLRRLTKGSKQTQIQEESVLLFHLARVPSSESQIPGRSVLSCKCTALNLGKALCEPWSQAPRRDHPQAPVTSLPAFSDGCYCSPPASLRPVLGPAWLVLRPSGLLFLLSALLPPVLFSLSLFIIISTGGV